MEKIHKDPECHKRVREGCKKYIENFFSENYVKMKNISRRGGGEFLHSR